MAWPASSITGAFQSRIAATGSSACRRSSLDRRLKAVRTIGGIPETDHVVGSSKTIRSLARLAGSTEDGVGSEERSILKLSQLDDWLPRLARIPADARPNLPGITADRTFQIVAGGIVLSETMRAFKTKVLEVSPWALREGLILRRLDRME